MAKYDQIGIEYNQTRKADPYLASRMIALLDLRKNGKYLDIGCGTGNYTSLIQEDGFDFVGIDPSREMLDKARINQNIEWILGSAESISLKSASIDAVLASLTLHHWTSLKDGFKECYRILKNDGHMLIFTATPKQMKIYWLNDYFPLMLKDSMEQMPTFDHIEKASTGAGFKIELIEKYFIQDDLKDHFLYCGKNNPKFYFLKEIRAGISSFSSLANKSEVEAGLIKLKEDIKTGNFSERKESFKDSEGDYIFIRLRK